MNIIEEEMDRILGCDECEIMEFDFGPLFRAVRAMQAEHAKQVNGLGSVIDQKNVVLKSLQSENVDLQGTIDAMFEAHAKQLEAGYREGWDAGSSSSLVADLPSNSYKPVGEQVDWLDSYTYTLIHKDKQNDIQR